MARLHALLETAGETPPYVPPGRLALVVLTRGVRGEGPRPVHAGMAKLTTDFRHTVAAGAGHEIHLFEPSAALQAVQDVLAAVKNRKPLPTR